MADRATTKQSFWQQIVKELHPAHLLQADQLVPTVVSGLLIGIMTTILSVSFAALVFTEAMPEALSMGIGMALVSNIVLHLFVTLTSSVEGMIGHVQNLPPPIQATMMAALVASLPASLSAETRLTTAIFMLMLSAILTGGMLVVFGRLKIGRLVRFLPYPVISGFLASVGVSLILGGMGIMTGQSIKLQTLGALFTPAILSRWLPGIAFTIALYTVMKRRKHVLTFPTAFIGAILIFFGIMNLLGSGLNQLMADGWLLGPFVSGRLWQPPAYDRILTIDWSLISSQIGTMVTIPIVCLISILLSLSAIELTLEHDVNPDYELQINGAGNVLAGVLGGGFIGYVSMTFTFMQHNLGAKTRLTGLLSTLVPTAAVLAGASLLGFVPRIIIGGLLVYFGYQFVEAWVFAIAKQSPLTDMLIIGMIVVTTLWLGFVPAVGVGVLVAAMLFLFNYSRTSVVRYQLSRASHQSRLTRNTTDSQWLLANGEKIAIFGLQGYIFFGTASNLLEQIMMRVDDATRPALSHVLLDFRHVTGIDSSVVQNFQKLQTQLSKRNVTLVLSKMIPAFVETMQHGGFAPMETAGFELFDSFDEALEWCEDRLLHDAVRPVHVSQTLHDMFAERFQDEATTATLLGYLERQEVTSGARLIEQGATADDLFFVESGRVSAQLERADSPPIRLQTMTEDTLVGEIGLYLAQPRGATVVADEDSVVYRLSAEALATMEQQHPAVAIELHRLIVEKTASRVNHLVKTVSGLMPT